MGYWHNGPDGWGWLWMVVVMAVVWLPLLIGGLWLLTRVAGPPPPPTRDAGGEPPLDAVEIARRAYARGELPRERYLQIIEDLQRDAEPPRA